MMRSAMSLGSSTECLPHVDTADTAPVF